jgi:hypothetical protein
MKRRIQMEEAQVTKKNADMNECHNDEGPDLSIKWEPGIYKEISSSASKAAVKAGVAMGRAGITDKAWLASGSIQNEFGLTTRQRTIVAKIIKRHRNAELARLKAASRPEPRLSISHWGFVA